MILIPLVPTVRHCGYRHESLPVQRTLKLATSAIVSLFLLSACASRTVALEVQVGNGSPFKGLNLEGSAIDGSAIEVTLKNSGRRAAKQVRLACEYFDAQGGTVVTGAVYFDNLKSGDRRSNKVLLPRAGVVRGSCAVR